MKALPLFALLLCSMASARWARVPFEGIRPASLGGAFLAVADDKNALWYNPAGLSRLGGMTFDLYDFILGADSLDSLGALKTGLLQRQTSTVVSTGTQFSRFSFSPTFFMQNFGVSLFYNFQNFSEIENLAVKEVDLYGVSDLGLIAGYSYPFTPNISAGVTLKALQRNGIDTTRGADELLTQLGVSSDTFLADVYGSTRSLSGKGWGIGASLGFLASMALTGGRSNQWRFGATLDNIGGTKFKKMGGSNPPTSIPMSLNFGTAAVYTLGRSTFTCALDFVDLAGGLPGLKSSHVGLE